MSEHDDAFERRLRRAWRRSARAGVRPSAPTDDEIVDLVLGRLRDPERERVADAVVADPDLAARVRSLLRVERESSAELAPRRAGSGRIVVWAAAASILLAAAIVAWNAARREGSPDSIRGGVSVEDAGFRPEDGARLPAPPERLSWAPVPGAVSYSAALYDATSAPIWRSGETSDPSIAIPEEVRAELSAPGTYYWRVRYRVGAEERTLPLAELRIGP